jgi:hypothetical protein
MFVINTISEFFNDTVKKKLEDDQPFDNKLTINMFFVKNLKYVHIFNRYFEEFEIEVEERTAKNYQLTITTKKTLHELFNFTNLFVIFNVFKNGDTFDANLAIEKYLGCLEVAKAPYFIKYVFKVNFLRNKKQFLEYKEVLEKDCIEDVKLSFGDTNVARKLAVKEKLSFTNSIVDVGCGNGHFLLDFYKHLNDNSYYALDKDEDCRKSVEKKVEIRKFSNVHVLDSFQTFEKNYKEKKPCDFLLAEVVEHMSLEEATGLVSNIVSFPYFNSLIITTPNKDFNQFYLFEDDESRYHDHQFEFRKKEFLEWLQGLGAYREFFPIGDVVNGHCTTLGAKITK